jgi:parallel beta-helix repeat protein
MTNRETKRARIWRSIVLLACAVALATPGANTLDLCGATVLEDLTLDEDLACGGDGLVVGAGGIRIDLNGHRLTGSGLGIGIALSGNADVTIMNGTISSFAVGIRTTTVTDLTVKHMTFLANAEGVDFQAGSVGNTVKNSSFSGSTIRAIMLRANSRDNDIKDNTFTGNRVGILVFGGIENTLKGNTISGSSLAGIRFNVIAAGNVVKDNLVQSNAIGIDFLVTPTGSSVGNEIKDNTIALNVCGLNGPTAGNVFKDNSFEGNTTETCG